MPLIFFNALYLKAKMMMKITFLNLKRCDPAFAEFPIFFFSIQEMEFGIWALKEYP